jgi:triacylglycerol lipase
MAPMSTPYDPTQAAFYGNFVNYAYQMYDESVKQNTMTPPAPSGFPSSTYQIKGYITAVDAWLGLFDQTALYGYVAQSDADQSAIVAIRGTQSDLEWLIDAEILPTEFTPIPAAGLVEDGFFSVFESMSYLDPSGNPTTLPSLLAPGKPVTLAAHSLGSSIATMLAMTMIDSNIASAANLTLYTLASPAVGDGDFATWFNDNVPNSFRVWNELDLVPWALNAFYTQVNGNGNPIVQSWPQLEQLVVSPACEHSLASYLWLLDPTGYSPLPQCQVTDALKAEKVRSVRARMLAARAATA